jgi:hypothetical protein
LKQAAVALLAFGGTLAATGLGAADAVGHSSHSSAATVTVSTSGGGAGGKAGDAAASEKRIVIRSIEPSDEDERVSPEGRSWLGVSIEEASEALASQLGLESGAGLVVTYVAPDSPAAKAGLEKNDVLVELGGQLLVHPAQLRKLVQARKEGDTIKLGFYRAGKKETASATVAKAPAGTGLLEDGRPWKESLQVYRNLLPPDAARDLPKTLRESLGTLKLDQFKVQEEVRRSLEQARKAYQEALRSSSNALAGPVAKVLKDLYRSRVDVDKNATVTVRNTGQKVKTMVKADDSGTIVIVCNPKPRLTAHDKEGKLLFDGEVDTPEQRAKVPPALWEKVEPLLDKADSKAEEEPETDPGPAKETSFLLERRPVLPPMAAALVL